MAGRKGRSGRKPLSPIQHILKGTFRPDRHGLSEGGAGSLPIDPELLARLGEGLGYAGRALCEEILGTLDDWDPRSLAFLRLAAEARDRAVEIKAQIDAQGVAGRNSGRVIAHPLLRHERAAAAAVLANLRAIDIVEDAGATGSCEKPLSKVEQFRRGRAG